MEYKLSEEVKERIKNFLKERIKNKVELTLILDYKNKEQNELAKSIALQIMELSEKVRFEFINANSETGKEILKENSLDLDEKQNGPIIFFKEKPNVIYFGFPIGLEFQVFLNDLEKFSNKNFEIDINTKEIISQIKIPLKIFVFVTALCPYCPIMSSALHEFAFINEKIKGIVVQSEFFDNLVQKFNVYHVPKTVIMKDNKILDEFEGAISKTEFAERIWKVI